MARNLTQWFSSAGGALAIVMPKGLCPICVAASGGVLASLGLGFLVVESTVRWLLAGTLSIGLLGLALSARGHRRWWTVLLGAVGVVTIMVGRFLLVDAVLYGGMVPLTAAMATDFWARRHPSDPPPTAARAAAASDLSPSAPLTPKRGCSCETSKFSPPAAPAATKLSAP